MFRPSGQNRTRQEIFLFTNRDPKSEIRSLAPHKQHTHNTHQSNRNLVDRTHSCVFHGNTESIIIRMVFGKSRSILLVATLQYCLSFSPPTWAPTCLSCSVRQGKATLARKADASQPASHGFQDISSPLDFSSASSKNLPLKPFLIGSTALYASPNIEDDEPTAELSMARRGTGRRGNDVGGFDPLKDKLPQKRDTVVVGEPQKVKTESMNIEKVLAELQAIQSQGSKKYCILGTRHCSFLHQQIIEML